MNNLLSYIDNLIVNYYNKNKDYPKHLIMNKETKKKFIEQYRTDLNLDFVDCIIVDKEDNYKGVPIKVDEKETLVRAE
jgi:hypothetical protein